MKVVFEAENLLLMMSVPSERSLPKLSANSAKIIKYYVFFFDINFMQITCVLLCT